MDRVGDGAKFVLPAIRLICPARLSIDYARGDCLCRPQWGQSAQPQARTLAGVMAEFVGMNVLSWLADYA